MEFNSYKNQTNELLHPSNNFRKSVSSINVGYVNNGRVLRESHSFTDGVQENYRLNHDDDGHSDKDSPKENAVFYIWTKQINSFEPFMVFEEMLTFQGKRYSQSEIAPIWKKDCRMWLWKTRQPRISKKVDSCNLIKILRRTKLSELVDKNLTKLHCNASLLQKKHDYLSVIIVKLAKLKLV